MARKDVVLKKIASAQSLAADFISEVTTVQWLDNVSYQINVNTTDSIGEFAVEVSLDYVPANAVQNQQATPGNWVELTLAGGNPVVAAEDDVISVALNQVPFKAIRLRYTAGAGGDGVCDIFINARQVGG